MPLAAVIRQPRQPVELCDFPPPKLEPGSVLLETIYSEVCGTDVHLQQGRLDLVPYPIIPGHVSVGRVQAVAGCVQDVDQQPIQVDDVVTFLDVHETCNHCWYCLVAKASTRCPRRKVYGITYSSAQGLLGGWSEQIYLKPGVKILKLPRTVSPRRLIAAGCALPTALHAIERAAIKIGQSVAVQGAGPVGLNLALLAQISGAGQVLVIDSRESRLQAARAVGIDEVVRLDPDRAGDVVGEIRSRTAGRGADITLEATGVAAAVAQGMQMTRDDGRYIIVGQYTDGGPVAVNPHHDINRKHLEIRGCWGSDFSHFYRMVQVLAKFGDRLPGGGWESLITNVYGLSEANEALHAVATGQVVKAVVDPHKVSGQE